MDERANENIKVMAANKYPRLNAPRRNKYNAKPTVYKGRKYDSKAEATYAKLLDKMQDKGIVHLWLRQISFDLGEDTRYRADFFVIETNGDFYAVDVKGYESSSWKRIRKLWAKYGIMPLHVVKNGRLYEIIERINDGT